MTRLPSHSGNFDLLSAGGSAPFVIFSVVLLSLVLFAGCSGTTAEVSPQQDCKAVDKTEIARLFNRWSMSLESGDPERVITNYAESSTLRTPDSGGTRKTAQQKREYFTELLTFKPSAKVDQRTIRVGCNYAEDFGLYTLTFAQRGIQTQAKYLITYKWDGKEWLISSHHATPVPDKN